MSARGKPNARKVVRPNIAAATRVKPEKSENDSTNGDVKAPNRGRGRGRNNASRGTGRGASRATTQIVQQEGTFTMGLAEGSLKSNRQSNYGSEEIIGKLDKSVNGLLKPKKERKDSKGETKSDEMEESMEEDIPITYAAEWLSDNELDEIELYELINSEVVSDIKKGREAPVVLPQKDLKQFHNLVRGSKNGSTIDASQEAAEASQQVEKDCQKDRTKASHPAELVQKYLNDQSGDLMLLQMPASLDVVHQVFTTAQAEEKMEVDEKPQPSSSTQASSSTQQKHCMDGLPTGAEIGKLQLLKNGKVRLVIGNRVMDMHEAIPSKMFETVVQTQTFPTPKPEPGTSSSQSSNNTNTGSMTVLGNVGDSFLCTYNVAWDG